MWRHKRPRRKPRHRHAIREPWSRASFQNSPQGVCSLTKCQRVCLCRSCFSGNPDVCSDWSSIVNIQTQSQNTRPTVLNYAKAIGNLGRRASHFFVRSAVFRCAAIQSSAAHHGTCAPRTAGCPVCVCALVGTRQVQTISPAYLFALYLRYSCRGSDLGANVGAVAGLRRGNARLG